MCGCTPVPSVRLGRRLLIRGEALRAWIEQNEAAMATSNRRQNEVSGNTHEGDQMRRRQQTGGLKKQRGEWLGQWLAIGAWRECSGRSRT